MDSNGPYEELIKRLNLQINCLLDEDRNKRRDALTYILSELTAIAPTTLLPLLTRSKLPNNLRRTLTDKIESNRQLTIEIYSKITSKLSQENLSSQAKDVITSVVQSLIQRINTTPFSQSSEQLRIAIVQLFRHMLVFHQAFSSHIVELANGLGKCLLDPSPQLKKKCCQLIELLCQKHNDRLGMYSASVIKSLTVNLGHQQSKIRLPTVVTLGKLLATKSAGANFDLAVVAMKALLSDKISGVRKATYQSSANLLKYLAPKYLKVHEATLVSFLLSGLSDQNPQNQQRSIQLLQQCGKSLMALEQNSMQFESGESQMIEEQS